MMPNPMAIIPWVLISTPAVRRQAETANHTAPARKAAKPKKSRIPARVIRGAGRLWGGRRFHGRMLAQISAQSKPG